MTLKTFVYGSAAALFAGLLAGCMELELPRFDGGLLNPDIRLLRAGDVLEGVKCAMVAFMHEREEKLMDERINPGIERDKVAEIETRHNPDAVYSPYELNLKTDLKGYRQCGRDRHYDYLMTDGWSALAGKKGCVDNRCDAALAKSQRLGATVWDYQETIKNEAKKTKGCVQVPDYSRLALDPTQSANIELTLLGINSGFMFYQKIDALKTPFFPFIQPGGGPLGAPFPTLQVTPKGTTTFDITTVMAQSIHTFGQTAAAADYAPDAIARSSTRLAPFAILEKGPLTSDERGWLILARNMLDFYGDRTRAPEWVAKLKVETDRLDLQKIIDGGTGELDAQTHTLIDRVGRRVTMTAQLFASTQALISGLARATKALGDGNVEQRRLTLYEVSKNIKKAAGFQIVIDREFVKSDEGKEFRRLVEKDELHVREVIARALDNVKVEAPQANEFFERCHPRTWSLDIDDKTRVDFLALKSVLNNVVDRQDKQIAYGIPDVTLSSLVLTSAFQLVLEASAGTTHLFRILPVLVPPQTDLRFDHTHTLKITLNGKKNKGDKQLAKKLTASCQERLGKDKGTSGKSPDFCTTEAGQLLESIVQAVEKGGTSSGQ